MTPKPLVKLIMHLRMLEFFPKCEGEWVAYLERVKGIGKKNPQSGVKIKDLVTAECQAALWSVPEQTYYSVQVCTAHYTTGQ